MRSILLDYAHNYAVNFAGLCGNYAVIFLIMRLLCGIHSDYAVIMRSFFVN